MVAVELNRKQNRFLKGMGHKRKAIVQLGHKGATTAVIKQLDQALKDHELVKVRLCQNTPESRETVAELCRDTLGCAVVDTVGHTLVFYRPREDPEERTIKLPA